MDMAILGSYSTSMRHLVILWTSLLYHSLLLSIKIQLAPLHQVIRLEAPRSDSQVHALPRKRQGLTLIHFSAEPEPFLTQYAPWTRPNNPLNTRSHPLNTP